jgi:uncharacterized membrane protein YdjX (TVP38/TMEM64 family)
MEETLITLLEHCRIVAIPLSVLINIVVAIVGILPTFFITGANIALFGPYWGGALSIVGEALGAIVSFWIYRKGFRKVGDRYLSNHPSVKKIISADRRDAGFLVFLFRLMPYMPSGLITLAAALSRMSLWTFTIASTLGKFPALTIEVLSVYYVLKLPLEGILTVTFGALFISFIIRIVVVKKSKTIKG